MNIFLTGASGYIGGSIAVKLTEQGHTVRGLVRDPTKAQALARRGVVPVLGNLDDVILLSSEVRRADGIINAADSDHRAAVDVMLASMQQSGKPFLHTSGTSVFGDDAKGLSLSAKIFTEDAPQPVDPHPFKRARYELDRHVIAAAQDGVRSLVICNPIIYGQGCGLNPNSAQIPPLLAQAMAEGVVKVVGIGANRWSTVHIDDLVSLYALCLEKGEPGTFLFAENGEASFNDIGWSIAMRLQLGEPTYWAVEDAGNTYGEGFTRAALASNSRVCGIRAKRDLGWAPQHAAITRWIEQDMPLLAEEVSFRRYDNAYHSRDAMTPDAHAEKTSTQRHRFAQD